MTFDAQFQAAHPKPVNIPGSEYAANKADIDVAAAANGYRFVGIHSQTKEAVFSTKELK